MDEICRKVWYSVLMKKIMMKITNCIVLITLTAAVAIPLKDQSLTVRASSITDIQNQINKDKNDLNQINNAINNLSEEQEIVQEKIDDLNSEVVNMMTSIGLKEDEIAAKLTEIDGKQMEIEQAQKDYDAAKQREDEQYEAMKVRIKLMYENSSATSLLDAFLESKDFSEFLNRAAYIGAIYEYDQMKLDEYEATKNQVQELWDRLEAEKAQLEEDKTQLENDRAALQSQKAELDRLLAQKKQESVNYDAEIQKYKQSAAAYKKKIQQEEKDLKKLQQQQNKPSSNAANGNYTVTQFDTSVIDNASGSDLGKKIAKYGCQYIGNPYVTGGTSLTNGADCSGFTYRIYKDFGYNLPRTSYEQRSAGTGGSYDQAQPGDLICYDGHVALYVGGGKIVHASTTKTGIKISNATYRSILSVRRII